jgi:predicted HicB family RNase H-like nuclease
MSSAQFDAFHEKQDLTIAKNLRELQENMERREERLLEEYAREGIEPRRGAKGQLLTIAKAKELNKKDITDYTGRPKGAPRKKK